MNLNKFTKLWYILLLIPLVFVTSCGDDDDTAPVAAEDAIASFQFAVSENNFLEVTFTNFSQNATVYAWDFGDAAGTSAEENPVYAYTEAGTYTVKLTAFNAEGTAVEKTESIIITNPNEALALFTGETSKTWKLFREGTSMSVGADADNAGSFWAGLSNDGTRNCLYDQTITFGADGSYVFDDMGMFWAEFGLFNNVGGCDQDTPESCFDITGGSIANACGADISTFLSGSHTFDFDASSSTITLNGMGAWIGIPKLGTTGERLVPEGVTSFQATIEEFTGYDVMKVEFTYDGLYWLIQYVSYSDASLEPELSGALVTPAFTFEIADKTATFTNTSQNAESYSWDFGDGSGTSTDENPVYTYAEDGAYDVVLTASGSTDETVTINVTIGGPPFDTAAPTPTQAEADVISIYSDAYTDIDGVNLNPNWGQATIVTEEMVGNDNLLKLGSLNYQGIDWTGTTGGSVDVTGMTMVHVDIWSEGVETINLSLISVGAENAVLLTTAAGTWTSFDVALSEYTTADKTAIIQFKFDDASTGTSPTIFVDNMYFY